ncbi:MAG: hypothetical protein ACT4PL_08395 [Phycisphaerales bacterium]
MHIVTKILVIFGALFSVLLAALTIAFSTNADRLKEAVTIEQAKSLAFETNYKASEATKTAELSAAQERAMQAEKDREQMRQETSKLQAERATLLADLSTARLGEQGAQNKIDSLTAAMNTQAATVKNLTEEATNLRSAMVASSKRENELVDRLNDEQSRRTVLEQSMRALQEQLQEAKLAIDRAKQGESGASGGMPFVASGPIVKARITKIMPNPAGGELVEISEGSNVNLKANQQLTIVRNGQFIATVVLVQVEAQGAIGRVDKLGRDVMINTDDTVLSRLF